MSELKRTQLYDVHVSAGATMVDFGGYTRQVCGLFDVSHMGRLLIEGPQRKEFLQHVLTSNVSALDLNMAQYCIIPNENGGAVDDAYLYLFQEDSYLLVVNAANIDKDVEWFKKQTEGFDVVLSHESDYYGQLAIQGPEAEATIEKVLEIACSDLKFYEVKTLEKDGETIIISRTGYTGEDGFELYGSHEYIRRCWDKLIEAGVKPCGLGCRDTLRFEVGLPLYGDELSDKITPVMAGLSMFVKFDKDDFIGKEALLKQKTEGPAQRLRGIKLDGNAVPRHGYKVLKDGQEVGEVTTGYRLISAEGSCCVALVDASVKMDDRVEVQIRKKTFPGTVVKKKFYDKHYKK